MPKQVVRNWVEEYELVDGNFDIKAVDPELYNIIPTPLDMGKIYTRLSILLIDEDYISRITRVYNDEICEIIDDYNNCIISDVSELYGGLPEDDEMNIAYSLYNKPVLYGNLALNYQRAYVMVSDLESENIFMLIGCFCHTAITCDLREILRVILKYVN